MSNRFSRWAPTEYVPLPIDYYTQSLVGQEQRVQSSVDTAHNIMTNLRSVTPTGLDAQAYEQQLLAGLTSQLEGMNKQDLKTPEALSKINAILSDPKMLSGFRDIAMMTEDARDSEAAYKEHVKENGNDVNATPYRTAMRTLGAQTGDASKFDKSLFKGTDVMPKYMEVQKEVNDTLKDMKENGYTDPFIGKFISIKEISSISPERLKRAAVELIKSRKDLMMQSQRNIEYDVFNTGIEDKGEALKKVAAPAIAEATRDMHNAETALALAKKDRTGFKKKYKVTEEEFDKVKNYYQDIYDNGKEIVEGQDDPETMHQAIMMKNMNQSGDASAAIYSVYKEKLDLRENKFELMKLDHELDYETWRRKHDYELEYLLKLSHSQTEENELGASGPLMGVTKEQMDQQINSGTFLENFGISGVKIGAGNDVIVNQPLAAFTQNGPLSYLPAGPGYTNPALISAAVHAQKPVVTHDKDAQIMKTAVDMGFDSQDGHAPVSAAVDFLKTAFTRTHSVAMRSYTNPNLNSEAIARQIGGGFTGIHVSLGGTAIVEGDKMREVIQNDLTGIMADKTMDGNITKHIDFHITMNPYSHSAALTYTDPRGSGKQVLVDMPIGMAKDFEAARVINTASLDYKYRGGQSVRVNNEQYGLFRWPNGGVHDVFGFKDADAIAVTKSVSDDVLKLANVFVKEGSATNITQGIVLARDAINRESTHTFNNIDLYNDDKKRFIVHGMDLGAAPYVIVNQPANPLNPTRTDYNPQNIRVALLKPGRAADGNVYGGKPKSAEDLERDAMEQGISERSSRNAAVKDVRDRETKDIKIKNKLSITTIDR